MISSKNIKNIERKIREFNENLLLFEQQFVIIPFLPSGYVDYSNFGQVQGQKIISDYETYKRVWTGNDSFIITWKDSVTFTQNEQGTKNLINFKCGDAILGWLENNTSLNQIETDKSFDYYKSQTSEQSLTFRVNANEFELDTNWEFMFYKVPELSGEILYRVESIEKEYVGRDLLCYVLNLKALNQDLANTGQAKQQNVMPNSPGQGCFAPQVLQEYTPKESEIDGVDYIKFYDRWIIPNFQKRLNRPCKKIVVKAFGMCLFSNVACWGRKVVEGGDFQTFGIQRWIFPINITNASTYTFYRTQNAETNFYWVKNALPYLQSTADSFEMVKALYDTNKIWTQQGFLDLTSFSDVKSTNPNDGGYQYQLFGENVQEQGKIKYKPWIVNYSSPKKFQTDTILGCAQYYTIQGQQRIHDLMFHSFWIQKNIATLPLTQYNSLNFGWNIGSALASLTSKNFITSGALLLIGLAGTLINKTTKPKLQGIMGFVPAAPLDFMMQETAGLFKTSAGTDWYTNKIKLSYFENFENENETNKFFNTQTINTSFQADLTDLIQSDRLLKNSSETTCIGQTTWDDGSNVCKDGSAFLLNGDAKLVALTDAESDIGYIIDAINIQGVFMGDYSIEFLDKNDEVIWSGIYQSQGKWTGSVREINTWINTSIYGRENIFIGKPLPWPKELPDYNLIGYEKQNPITVEFGADEKGYKVDYLDTPKRTQNPPWPYPPIYWFYTLREILQNEDKLGLTWEFNVGTKYVARNLYNRAQATTTEIVIKSNWTRTLQDFLGLYQDLTIDFDLYCLNGNPTRESSYWYLKNVKIQNNRAILYKNTLQGKSRKYSYDDYNISMSKAPSNAEPDRAYHLFWNENYCPRDVEGYIYKNDLEQIVLSLSFKPSSELQHILDFKMGWSYYGKYVDYAKTADDWLGIEPYQGGGNFLPTSGYFQLHKHKIYYGQYIRAVKVVPYLQ